jgi:hypothetical protein
MTYDDDPYNDDDRRAKWISLAVVVIFCLSVFALLAWIASAKAQDYLPPQRYRNVPEQPQAAPEDNPAGPNEYYAEDWIVYDAQKRVICKDPYIRLDLKVVECTSTEKWR